MRQRALEDGKLTPLGRQLAQLPIDPRLGRMVLEAERNGCLREVLIIASALAIQDPRERPYARAAAADRAQFGDELRVARAVEHDPGDIWDATLATLGELVERLDGEPVAALGITNQRETTVVWDRRTGRPRHRARGVGFRLK